MHLRLFALFVLSLAVGIRPAIAQTEPTPPEQGKPEPIFFAPEVDAGFRLLYELRFSEARERFAMWRQQHPEDPLGDVSIAASYLFEEFYNRGVLSSDFFLNDNRLLGGIEGKIDEKQAMGFNDANRRAREIALQRLKIDAHDPRALYALTLFRGSFLTTGMEADYLGILEKRHFDSLRLVKQAEGLAEELLIAKPDAQDARVALGTADYLIGSLPAHERFFLKFGGIHGNKKVGLDELRQAAEKGQYLRPYAKLLLALACLREKQDDMARVLLSDLSMEFPNNPLFALELARLNIRAVSSGGGH